jgi:IPT/TIG domain-containing protein
VSNSERKSLAAFAAYVIVLTIVLVSAGCGGGGGGTGPTTFPTPIPTPTPTPAPPAAFSFFPTFGVETAVSPGSSASFAIRTFAIDSGDRNFTLQFQAAGLPAGVSAAFSPNPVPLGNDVSITLTAAANTAFTQNAIFTVTGTRSANPVTVSQDMSVAVVPPPGQRRISRTDFIENDGNIRGGALDLAHNLLFISDANWNRVQVLNTFTKTIVKEIPVPQPQGVDLSVDGTKVFVGTATRSLFVIDTTSLQVVEELSLPFGIQRDTIDFFAATVPCQMANGKILLISRDPRTSIRAFLEWDLVTNTVTQPITDPTFSPDYLFKSSDGTRAIIGSNVDPGAATIYDSASDSLTASLAFPVGFEFPLAASPDGSRFIMIDDVGGLLVYDSSLRPLFSLPPGPFGGVVKGAVYSPDGTKIYLTLDSNPLLVNNPPVMITYNSADGTILGVAPALALLQPFIEGTPPFEVSTPLAADASGIIYSATDHGIAVEDAAFTQHYGLGNSNPLFSWVLSPQTGPINATTQTVFKSLGLGLVPDVWFGTQPATNLSIDPVFFDLTADVPVSTQPGPVNVKVQNLDGTQVFYPDGFTYGPSVLHLSASAGSPAGGAQMHIMGLGFPLNTTAGISVSVGGQAATVLSSTTLHYGPFPTFDATVQLPAGVVGPADVSVTTAAGSTTVSGAFRFVRQMDDFASAVPFQAVLFDHFRNQVYLSAGDHIAVFSVAGNSFLNSIPMPAVTGTPVAGALGLTPDGSRLLVGNFQDGSLAVIDPDNAANNRVALLPGSFNIGTCAGAPISIAPTSVGTAVIKMGAPPAFNCNSDQLDLVDLTTLQPLVTQLAPGCLLGDVVSDNRGSVVVMSSTDFCTYSPASNTWNASIFVDGSFSSPSLLAVAGDGTFAIEDRIILDSVGHTVSVLERPDALYDNLLPAFAGEFDLQRRKFNASGSLVYLPFPHSLNIFDSRHGQQLLRVALKQTVQNVFFNIAVNTEGDKIFLITDAGLTVIGLDQTPLAIATVTPGSGPAGTQLQIKGSGFSSATTVTFNGILGSTLFVDPSTLSVTVPSLPPGPVVVSVHGGSGESYELQHGFAVQ